MSLTRDGVWKANVWASTVWTQDVWFEDPAPAPVATVGGGGGGALDMGEDFIYERPKKIKHAMLEAMAERGYIPRHKDEPIAALKHIEAYDETDDLESILWLDD